MIIGVAIFVGVVIAQAPKIDTDKIYDILTESTIIYDDNGNEIDTVYTEANRSNVKYDDIPKNLINAFVALEDKTFGITTDLTSSEFLAPSKLLFFSGGDVSGTSTITQQLARNLFLRETMFDHSIKRKSSKHTIRLFLRKI